MVPGDDDAGDGDLPLVSDQGHSGSRTLNPNNIEIRKLKVFLAKYKQNLICSIFCDFFPGKIVYFTLLNTQGSNIYLK